MQGGNRRQLLLEMPLGFSFSFFTQMNGNSLQKEKKNNNPKPTWV
jgi:hypothetical protein